MLTTPNCREACRSGKEASGVRSDIHATKDAFRTAKGHVHTPKETRAKTSSPWVYLLMGPDALAIFARHVYNLLG
jgi:hypothetical protein